MIKHLLIAVDGPVGAGKSTISDAVAKHFGILHLDTGAMYRAFSYKALQNNISLDSEEAISALCPDTTITVKYHQGQQQTLLDGEDVSAFIRTQTVSQAASAVSRYSTVRQKMVALQRAIAMDTPMLLDGRDIGTVVLKNATAKIYLTASSEARAKRREKQLLEKGEVHSYQTILQEVIARDLQDENRAIDPLRKAEDAVVVDSSDLNFAQTVQAIIDIVEGKINA